VIPDPARRGRAVAELWSHLGPGLFRDLEESGLLPVASPDARRQALREWEHFSLYACVRALVAGGGFTDETGRSLDAFHAAALESLMLDAPSVEAFAERREVIAARYAEFGELGQKESRGGDPQVAQALGRAAARHMVAPGEPSEALAELVGSLHEALVEGAGDLIERGG
jgi:hypothetical protein